MPQDRFDEILNEMREENTAPEQVAEATDRVWRKLAGPALASCSEFRPRIDDYLAGRLAEPRRLLLEDHLGRCSECRRLFAEAKGERKVVAMPEARRGARPAWIKWAVAAGVALAALYTGRDRIDGALAPSGPRATVADIRGNLYRVSEGVIQPGAALADGEIVRTGTGARATLKLMDGSLVEINERTELSVHAAWSGQTVRLDRGDVIVQAAKQRRGYLRVATRDSIASVKGTTFAVSSGSAGSLVSVVEGRVDVQQPGTRRLLEPGQQAATSESLASVPVREAVSWSENADKYYELLAEFMTIEKQIADMPDQALRTQPRLLRYLPATAFIYGAIPNISGTVREALRIVESRTRDNATLREWWESPEAAEMRKLLDNVQTIAPLLGDEIVFVLAVNPARTTDRIPIVLAEVQSGRADALKAALDKVALQTDTRLQYRIAGDLLTVSENPEELAAALALLGTGATGPFAVEIGRRYQRGVGWLFGFDVPALTANEHIDAGGATLLGLARMRHLFFEQRSTHGTQDNEATLTFQGQRTGIASWLATPGAAGSAEYISSEAVFALSASTRNPRQAFDELLASLGTAAGNLPAELREFETETGINIANDIAAALGTDFTLIVERPAIPLPAWVGVMEVLNPAVLDATIRRVVDTANLKDTQHQHTLGQETVNGRVWMTLKSTGTPGVTLYWTYDRGYLIASTDRATAARAIATRENGTPVIRSARFRQALPGSGSLHYSGFVWVNAQGALRDLAGLVENPALKTLLENRDPALIVLNGETERIHAASRTRLTSLLLDVLVAHGPKPGDTQQRTIEKKLNSPQ